MNLKFIIKFEEKETIKKWLNMDNLFLWEQKENTFS